MANNLQRVSEENQIAENKKNEESKKNEQNLLAIKRFLNSSHTKNRINALLGQYAEQFTASIINTVNGNDRLLQCDPASILGAAFVAAALDLPIDPNLGFAAIVPFKTKDGDKAQFQIMVGGLIQLAIRSGLYQTINSAVVYEDEIISYNPITGELVFTDDFSKCTQRAKGNDNKIVGYYAYLKLTSGYTKGIYMTHAEAEAHGKEYSKSYYSGPWKTHFNAMAQKTVLKQLLKKWGALSVKMSKAIIDDQKVYFDMNDQGEYLDNPTRFDGIQPAIQAPGDNVIDVFAAPAEENTPTEEKQETIDNMLDQVQD